MAHPGHTARGVARSVPAVVVALVAAALTAGCGRDVASAPTTVHRPVDATVEHRDGHVVPATDGMRLRAGDVVRTAEARGRAELSTLDRVVLVGPGAVVAVVDGGRQQLRHGSVVVDARRGDQLRVGVAGFAVRVARGAVRVDRGYALRVGVLAGAADVTSAGGRAVRVRALRQVVAVGDALPDRATPLRLQDDAAERRVAPGLVSDDERLQAVADGMDEAPSGPVVAAVAATWGRPVPAVTSAAPASERILPVAIAVAAHADASAVYADRADGGSWAVVARLRGTDGDAALAALGSLERGVPTSALGSVDLAAAVTPSLGGAPSVVGTPDGGASAPGAGPTPTPTRSGSGSGPGPSPSPSPDLVTSVVDTVERILPTPVPTPSASQSPLVTLPGAPLPAPVPATGLG